MKSVQGFIFSLLNIYRNGSSLPKSFGRGVLKQQVSGDTSVNGDGFGSKPNSFGGGRSFGGGGDNGDSDDKPSGFGSRKSFGSGTTK